MFFSILIPVYNSDKYLKYCVNSILNQNFNSYEIILLDDGSTDDSPKICDEYKNLYNGKIKVIHKKNEGQLATRLKGLEFATGEYICYIDSDDTIKKNLLNDVYEIIKIYHSEIIFFNYDRIDEANRLLDTHIPIFNEGKIQKDQVVETIIKSDELNSLWGKVIKKSLFDNNNYENNFFNIKKAEDLIQILPIIHKSNNFYYLKKSYYNYRENLNSVTFNFNIKELKDVIVVRNYVYDFLIQNYYLNEKNLKDYYSFYFHIVWHKLYNYYIKYTNKNYKKDLSDLYKDIYNKRIWLKKINLLLIEKFGLFLFYKKKWKLLHFYFLIINLLYTLKINKIKDYINNDRG